MNMPDEPVAIVLSGGGNRGALQVGALQAFFEHGIRPDILVGTSAGAMNAAFTAADPSPTGVECLIDLWRQAGAADLFPGNILTQAFRFLLGKDSLYSSDNLRRFVEEHVPPGIERFGDITGVKLLLTAGDITTGTLYLFGEDPDASLVDGVVASAALPGVFPPVRMNGVALVDGATVANVPVTIAAQAGARTIYAVSLGYDGTPRLPARGALGVALQSIDILMFQLLIRDLQDVNADPGVVLHYIQINDFQGLPIDDFSHVNEMIRAGYEVTRAYLENPREPTEPLQIEWPVPAALPPRGARRWVR
ncbi:MAG: patatin-like phospholipase family protein [Anaerolineae bacterium]